MRAAAVFGAAGFIGSRLVATLGQRGVPVACFARDTPTTDRRGRLVAGLTEAETVFYLATGLTPAVAEQEPDRAAAERAAFTCLLGRLVKEGHSPTVVLTSSGGTVYDATRRPPYREDTPALPYTAYGRAKRGLERDLLSCDKALTPVVLRLSNVYGPGQPAKRGYGVLPHWLSAVAAGDTLRVFGSPRSRRDYVHVDDVVDALARVHFEDPAGLPRVLNIGSGRPTPLVELLALVVEVVGRGVLAEFASARPFDRRDAWLDVTEARRRLGWQSRIHLEEGVRETWERLVLDRFKEEARR